MRLAVLVLVAMALAACGDDSSSTVSTTPTPEVIVLPDDATITYRFGDASLPPEFHRSYTVTVTSSEVQLAVDSYGTPINEVTVAMDDSTWTALATVPPEIIGLIPETAQDCDGGTTRSLTIDDGTTSVVDVFTEACGGRGPMVAARIDAYIAPALALLGDLGEILAIGEEPPTGEG
jgi:hypothetical protein